MRGKDLSDDVDLRICHLAFPGCRASLRMTSSSVSFGAITAIQLVGAIYLLQILVRQKLVKPGEVVARDSEGI